MGSCHHEEDATLIDFYTWAAMGGHGLYVWSVYGISIVALVVLGAWPLHAEKKLLVRAMERTDEEGGS